MIRHIEKIIFIRSQTLKILFAGTLFCLFFAWAKPPIVLIHGMFQNPKSWENWRIYFEARGYAVHTPAYPFHEGSPAELRTNIRSGLGKLRLAHVESHLSSFIDTLPKQPVLIGHSMGGLVAQKLVASNKAVAAIAIDSAPPKGITSLKWSFLRANLPILNPVQRDSICVPTVKWFRYAFCNTMTLNETRVAYNRTVVPESRNLPRSSGGGEGRIDFKKPHAPLLFIAGEKDHIIPASLNRDNFKAYADTNSVKAFKEFPGRTHYLCQQEGWEEIAAYCESWIQQVLENRSARSLPTPFE